MDEVEEDLESIGVRGWRRRALEKAEWSKTLLQSRTKPIKGCGINDDDDWMTICHSHKNECQRYIIPGEHRGPTVTINRRREKKEGGFEEKDGFRKS